MKAFEYAGPTSIDAAIALLGDQPGTAEALSGGTDLLSRMKDYVSSPDRVVYLKDVKALAGISGDKASGLTLGAGTTLADVAANPAVKESYPALREVAIQIATPQIRNMATVGGNLLQRPRCWYFRRGYGLLAKKDGKSLIREGDNRYHSIFLTDGDALFTSPSCLAVPLIALGAKATIVGPKGERTVAVEDLYRVPKADTDRELTVAPGEILTKVILPAPKGKGGCHEVRHKQSHDWPLAMATVQLDMDGNTVSKARVVVYGVAPIPWRSEAAEKAIVGKAIDRTSADAAAEAAIGGAKPLSMNAYKVPLARIAVKRALLDAVGDRYWEKG